MGRGEELQYWHNRGQEDTENRPPHGLIDRLIDAATFQVFTGRPVTGYTSEEIQEDKDQYQKGRDNK